MRTLRLLLSSALVVALAVPMSASAAPLTVYKTGSQSCTSGWKVAVTAKGTGDITWYVPSSTEVENSYHGYDWSETYYSQKYSTTWKVTDSGGYLDDPGTTSWCWNPNAAPTHSIGARLRT